MKTEDKRAEITVPSFSLPSSVLMSDASHQAVSRYKAELQALGEQVQASIPADATPEEARTLTAELFYQTPIYAELLKHYPVDITFETIAGVRCEVMAPQAGISEQNADKVLINFHGGSFQHGSRTFSRMESAPIAALTGVKVISVDYRLAPEYQHPAAAEDAEAVYSELLKSYEPAHIGIFGSSAGASITAQLIYRLFKQNQPVPAATGLFNGGAFRWESGDYGAIGRAIYQGQGAALTRHEGHPYLRETALDDPSVSPGFDPAVFAHFPPSLLVGATRDFALSAVVHTHSRLIQAGIDANLHVWEGLEHVFHWNPFLPQTHEMHRVTAAFFEQHLNR